MSKDLKDYMPILDDQGIPNLVGTPNVGMSIQHKVLWPMVAGGVFNFEAQGLTNMDTSKGKYSVYIQNHTDAADEGTVAEAARLDHQMTIVGPDADDLLDIMIVGRLKGQTG